MMRKCLSWNKEEFGAIAAILGGIFLVLEAVVFAIMRIAKPDTTAALGTIFLPIMGGFLALFYNSAKCTLDFDHMLRFGVTRKNALVGIVTVMAAETAFALGLGWLLGRVDHWIAHRAYAGWPGVESVEIDVSLPLWALALAALVMVGLGLGAGAMLQRFGRKAFWVLWVGWMGLLILGNTIDWDSILGIHWLLPVGGLAVVLGTGWGVWSLLHATVRQ